MRILVEMVHPADVHFYKHAIEIWRARGDEVLVHSRVKDCTLELLAALEIPNRSISALPRHKLGLPIELITRLGRMTHEGRRFRPDVLTGFSGVTVALAGHVLRRPSVVFYDTEIARLTNVFVYRLAGAVCTPDCYTGRVPGRHVTFPSYKELAYLHPQRFTPDPSVRDELGLDANEPFFLLRFVAWQASHDLGEQGLSSLFKQNLVTALRPYGRVFISSEVPLPESLSAYACPLPTHRLHHALALASLHVGESATMAAESAVLGVPAVYISDLGRGYTDELDERYGLVHRFSTAEEQAVTARVQQLASSPDLGADATAQRTRMLADKVDLTGWMIDYLDQTVERSHHRRSATDQDGSTA